MPPNPRSLRRANQRRRAAAAAAAARAAAVAAAAANGEDPSHRAHDDVIEEEAHMQPTDSAGLTQATVVPIAGQQDMHNRLQTNGEAGSSAASSALACSSDLRIGLVPVVEAEQEMSIHRNTETRNFLLGVLNEQRFIQAQAGQRLACLRLSSLALERDFRRSFDDDVEFVRSDDSDQDSQYGHEWLHRIALVKQEANEVGRFWAGMFSEIAETETHLAALHAGAV